MAKTFDFEKFRYTPSLPLAIISLALFAILGLLSGIRTKSYWYLWITIGCIQVVGYAGRSWAHYDTLAWGPFLVQGIFLLIPPIFYAASTYMLLGRIIYTSGNEHLSRLSSRNVTRVFVIADVVTFLTQGMGGALMGSMEIDLVIAGEKVAIAGLSLQCFTFIVFLVVAVDFHLKALLDPKCAKAMKCMYLVSALILLRCLFRAIEYGMGNSGYLQRKELFVYVFDTLPMLGVVILFLGMRPERGMVGSVWGKGN